MNWIEGTVLYIFAVAVGILAGSKDPRSTDPNAWWLITIGAAVLYAAFVAMCIWSNRKK